MLCNVTIDYTWLVLTKQDYFPKLGEAHCGLSKILLLNITFVVFSQPWWDTLWLLIELCAWPITVCHFSVSPCRLIYENMLFWDRLGCFSPFHIISSIVYHFITFWLLSTETNANTKVNLKCVPHDLTLMVVMKCKHMFCNYVVECQASHGVYFHFVNVTSNLFFFRCKPTKMFGRY